MPAKRVLVIGLDCAPPKLVFERWADDLPVLARLRERGLYGELRSSIPPITVPAWASMMTGKDPGVLGFYGFRNRKDHSYDRLTFANSLAVKEPAVWDLLSKVGRKVVLVAVPQTYPPKPVNGCVVSCFLTPSLESPYTFPPELKAEIETKAGGYKIDVEDFRSEDKDRVLKEIYELTDKTFGVAQYLMRKKPWDFFMVVNMGTDRLHHGFWKFFDPEHRRYEPGNRYESVGLDYYRHVDRWIGRLLETAGEDCRVLVVSDHGAKKMDGGIAVNEWLQREGYLKLKEPVRGPTPIVEAKIDWARTRAWGEGGYYSRIFLNVSGREPQGAIRRADYEGVRDELIRKLEALGDAEGRPIGTKVHKPEDLYREVRGIAPDLIAIFGDLHWRSIGSLGLGAVHVTENDTGPDDANHSMEGIFLASRPSGPPVGRRLEGLQLMDVAPTILRWMGVEVPTDIQGRTIEEAVRL